MKDIITKITENEIEFPDWKNEYWDEDLLDHLDSLNRTGNELAEVIGWFIVKSFGETPKNNYKDLRKQINELLF